MAFVVRVLPTVNIAVSTCMYVSKGTHIYKLNVLLTLATTPLAIRDSTGTG